MTRTQELTAAFQDFAKEVGVAVADSVAALAFEVEVMDRT